jgi:gas vesicle protein
MKTKHFAKGLLFGAALVLASAAFAGEKASVELYDNVKVNGKTLPAGKYDLRWEGSGANVQLSIHQGKETVATVPAQIAATNPAPTSTGYTTKKEDDGSRSLTNVFFAGKKYTLNLEEQAAAAPAPAVSTSGTK